MRFYKIISSILHPIVMPIIGVLLYFIFTPLQFNKNQELILLSIIFIATYVIPLLILFFLKAFKQIESYQLATIKERKIPVFLIIIIYYILAKALFTVPITRDISYLFYGTVASLTVLYIFFFTKIKVSIHLLSMGNAVGFFLLFNHIYQANILPLIIVLILLSGLLASSRLYLKAHTAKEVYLGFFIGLLSQIIIYYCL